MSSSLAAQSNWERAKAAFHSIDWTSHMPLPTPHLKPLDIFCHPFNATMSVAATPVWEPDTIHASLSLQRIVYNTPSEESTTSFYLQDPASLSTSSLCSSLSSHSSSLSDLVSEEEDGSDGVPGSPVSYLSADWPSFTPPSPEQVRTLLLAETDASLPAWDEEIEQFKRDLCDSVIHSPSGGNKALPIGSPKVQDKAETEGTCDYVKESMEAAQELPFPEGTIQEGEDSSQIEHLSDSDLCADAALLPPRTPSPFEHMEPPCAIASSNEDAESDTRFDNVVDVFEKMVQVPEGYAKLEEYYPGYLRSLTHWMADEELDSPAECFLELALF